MCSNQLLTFISHYQPLLTIPRQWQLTQLPNWETLRSRHQLSTSVKQSSSEDFTAAATGSPGATTGGTSGASMRMWQRSCHPAPRICFAKWWSSWRNGDSKRWLQQPSDYWKAGFESSSSKNCCGNSCWSIAVEKELGKWLPTSLSSSKRILASP